MGPSAVNFLFLLLLDAAPAVAVTLWATTR
jgi:hypothetical protein